MLRLLPTTLMPWASGALAASRPVCKAFPPLLMPLARFIFLHITHNAVHMSSLKFQCPSPYPRMTHVL